MVRPSTADFAHLSHSNTSEQQPLQTSVARQAAATGNVQQVGGQLVVNRSQQQVAQAEAQAVHGNADNEHRVRYQADANGSYRQAGHRRKADRRSQPVANPPQAAANPPQAAANPLQAAANPLQAAANPPQAGEAEPLGRGHRAKRLTAAAIESADQAMLDSALLASPKSSQLQRCTGVAAAGVNHAGSKRGQRDAAEDKQAPKPKRVKSAAAMVMPPGILKASSMQMDAFGLEQLTQPKRVRFAVPIDDRDRSTGASHGTNEASGQNTSSAAGVDSTDESMPQRVQFADVHRPAQQRCRQRKGIPRRGAV